MTAGFTTGPILDDPQVRAAGIDAIPSAAFEGQDWMGLTRQLGRAFESAGATYGVADPESGQLMRAPEPQQDAGDLEKKYGIPGALKFDKPLPESVAQSLNLAKRDELAREDAARRSPADFWSQAGRLGAGFVANALDPLNLAAAFVPVVGEARYASWLAGAGSFAARSGVRAGTGFVRGAAGQALLAPLRLELSREEQADYHASDAFLDIVYGGLLSGGLHAVGGGIGDAVFRKWRQSPAAGAADADLPTRAAALRTAVAQLADERQVEIRPVFQATLERELKGSTSLTRPSGILPPELARLESRTADFGEGAPSPRTPMVAAANDAGIVRTFDDEKEAARVARQLTKRGDPVEVAPDGKGGFVLTRELEGSPIRAKDGSPLSFQTERAAQRWIDTAPGLAGRDLAVIPFGPAGQRLFAILEHGSDRDLAGLRARPELAPFGPNRPLNQPPAELASAIRAVSRTENVPGAKVQPADATSPRAPSKPATSSPPKAAVSPTEKPGEAAPGKAAGEQAPAAPPIPASPELTALQAANAQLEQDFRQSLSGEAPPEFAAAKAGVDKAEGVARAYQQAAVCLAMGAAG